MDADGANAEMYVQGVRNSFGMDWHPDTGELWFTDNGRDRLGDDVPSDELNRVTAQGQHFGYPYIHQGDLPDPEFGVGRSADEFVAPAQKLGPHVASLGFEFYEGSSFPPEYHGQIFIAEHGSWNRSEKIGYRVSLVRLDADGSAVSYETFADGWMQNEEYWGRPVDIEQMSDGSLLVSDDTNNAIYRISYVGS
jgi:glucose/arabinose dehydrogenase